MHTIAILLTLAASVFAQAKEPPASATDSDKIVFAEGEHYVRLSTPVRTADPNKIEVAEVFWYGCSHCYAFEPELQQWRSTLPEGVAFVESPAIWRKDMETHARIFYTSKVLEVLDVMHGAVFEAMHVNKQKLKRPKQIRALYQQHGVSVDDFNKTFNSFSVTSLVNQANARVRGYGIEGTPELIVDGSYRISGKMAGSRTNMLTVAEYLVCQINAENMAGAQDEEKTADSAIGATGAKGQSMRSFCASYR